MYKLLGHTSQNFILFHTNSVIFSYDYKWSIYRYLVLMIVWIPKLYEGRIKTKGWID